VPPGCAWAYIVVATIINAAASSLAWQLSPPLKRRY
jgi:hypothetical protein